MSALGTTQSWLTPARVNGRPVAVEQDHRCVGEVAEPVAVEVVAPVWLSVADVVAVLFDWNCPDGELADDDTVRYIVTYTVIGLGCAHIADVRCHLEQAEAALDGVGAAYLADCRARAAAVFGIGATGFPESGRAPTGMR